MFARVTVQVSGRGATPTLLYVSHSKDLADGFLHALQSPKFQTYALKRPIQLVMIGSGGRPAYSVSVASVRCALCIRLTSSPLLCVVTDAATIAQESERVPLL